MEIGQWWPRVSESTQVWLLQNYDTPFPAEVAADVAAAGGPARLGDTELGWLDEVNNGGSPQ